MRIALFLFLALLLPANLHAEEKTIIIQSETDYANTPWAKLKIPAGTKLITNDLGARRLEFKNDVSITDQGGGEMLGIDNSKTGAVLCLWQILVPVKASMDTCYPEKKQVRATMDQIVENLKVFIMANSLSPVNEADLDKYIQKRQQDMQGTCARENKHMTRFSNMSEEKLEELKKGIDASLALPRPPVLNPCL